MVIRIGHKVLYIEDKYATLSYMPRPKVIFLAHPTSKAQEAATNICKYLQMAYMHIYVLIMISIVMIKTKT